MMIHKRCGGNIVETWVQNENNPEPSFVCSRCQVEIWHDKQIVLYSCRVCKYEEDETIQGSGQ